MQLRPGLTAVIDVSWVTLLPEPDAGLRVWLDPDKLANRGLAAADVTRALEAQNLDVQPLPAAGDKGGPMQLKAIGRIENAAQELTRPFARLSVEAAVQAAPDVLVLAGVDPPKGRPVVPGLDRVPVAPLRSQALLHPGPRLVEALDDLEVAVRSAGPRVP